MHYAGYGKFITKYVDKVAAGVPIYTEDTAKVVAMHFSTDPEQARKVVNVTFKRLIGCNEVTELIRFQKGIYYKPKKTAFGRSLLNPMQIVMENYVRKGNNEFGYETGASLLNKLGLTTQIPKYRYFATNRCNRYGDNVDEKLKIVLRKPVTVVNATNRAYLQILDALQNKDKTTIDAVDAQERLTNFVEQNNLDFRKLIAFAQKYYGREVILRVAELAAGIEV